MQSQPIVKEYNEKKMIIIIIIKRRSLTRVINGAV